MKKTIIIGFGAVLIALFIALAPSVSKAQNNVDTDTTPNTSTCADISVALRYKSTDAQTNGAVSMLQDFLNAHGYLKSEPTGYFGSMTRSAVVAFQTDNGMSSNPPGFVGVMTRAKIKAIDCDGAVGKKTSVTLVTPLPPTITTPLPPTVYPTSLNRSLDIGSTGGDVVTLQTFLVSKGFLIMPAGVPMGSFDQTTKTALLGYQNAVGISSSDGVFGPATRAKVNFDLVTTPTVTTPSPVVITPSINLISPTAGQTWDFSNHTISWNSVGGDTVKILLGFNDGSNCEIGTKPSNVGSMSFNPTSYYCPNLSKTVTTGQYNITLILQKNGNTNERGIAQAYGGYFTIGSTINPPVVTPPVTTPSTACPQSITLAGTTYSLSPCSIDMSMTSGKGNRSFSSVITTSNPNTSYSYSIYGYGNNYPTYATLGDSSGGAVGNKTISRAFNDGVLSSNGASPKTYTGYLPVMINQGGNTGALYLNLNLNVNPASK